MKIPVRLRRFFRVRSREERPSGMVLTVTEDTPADMLAGSMELLVQLPREHHLHTQKVTVQRSTPMMDLLVQIATAHKLAASSYTLQAIGERGLVLPHQPNTPIGALDALQVKLLPKQGTFVPRKTKQANQPFETTFRLQVHLPRNQLYVSRVSPKMNLGEILDEVCREKNLDRSKYELRHPANLEETLDLSLSLQDYHLQEVTLYAKQGRSLGSALSTQDIMALQRQEERRRQQAKQGVFGFIFKKSKEGSLSTDSFGGRSTSPARSDETARSTSPLQPPARPQRKRRPAPKPPAQNATAEENAPDSSKDKVVISHSRNSSDSSGYHEASVLSDNPDSAGRLPETLPRRNRAPGAMETPRKLAQTSQSSKSLGNLATVSGTLTHAISSTSLSSTGLRKKRAAPPPPVSRPLSSAISSQALERIVDSEESLTSDMDPSKPPSDIGASSKACSDIEDRPKASSDIGVSTVSQMSSQSIESKLNPGPLDSELKTSTPPPEPPNPIPPGPVEVGQPEVPSPPEAVAANLEHCTPATRLTAKRADVEPGPLDTDVLLQKVSDTLSSSLPLDEKQANPPQSETKIPQEKAQSKPVSHKESENREKEVSGQINQDTTDSSEGVPLNNSTGSGTATSQQDTSDYVSAVDGDLSIPDWEYQLPAPPSAFRDTTSPAFDEYDTITLGSVEAFKEPIAVIVDDDRAESKKSSPRESSNKITSEKPEKSEKEEKPVKNLKKSDSSMELKKEVICELENKIGSGTLPQGIRESDSRKVDNLSTPRVAPVDNTLANFTITTYSRPKNVNIFDEVDHSASKKTSDDRFMKSFPTLARNRTNYESDARGKEASATMQRSKAEYVSLNDVELRKPEPKTEEVSQKWQSVKSTTEKVSVQRSRSYISSSERHAVHENDAKSDDGGNMGGHVDMRKATSTANLASVPKGNEKFSQWRENILKRQEEPTKEKQLQSLQVLKSILPQLKSAQQPEENVSKESSEAVLTEKSRTETGSNERSVEPNVVSTRESQKPNEPTAEVESNKAPEGKQLKKYTYSGPPAISLGSWSERPTVNVQIKKDTDYKFGGVHKTIGGRTIVNLNGMKDERVNAEVPKSDRTAENLPNKQEIISDKKSPSDLAKKLITHTTASGFKKPVLNRVSLEARPVDKPVVTGVELKKTFAEKNEANKNNDSTIDTSPVNFRELSRAFGQDVCLRPKPKRLNPNRRTEHFDSNPESLQKLDSLIKQNGHCDIPNGHSTGPEVKPKRFTSVVGITQNNSQTTNFPFRSGVSVKSNNAAMPVVKGFKMSSVKTNEPQKITNGTSGVAKSIPKPPTMPVITGVTLKSARPKSMPVQIDPRDMLLESIRSFGGRENLKSASGRC